MYSRIIVVIPFLLSFNLSATKLTPGATRADLSSDFVIPKGFFIGIEAGPMSKIVPLQLGVEPYFAVSAGYDVLSWMALSVTLGQAFVSAASESYSVFIGNIGGTLSVKAANWLELSFGLSSGPAYISGLTGYEAPGWGINGRGSIGLRYHTLLEGISLGAELSLMGLYVFKSDRVPLTLSLTPQLKYVF